MLFSTSSRTTSAMSSPVTRPLSSNSTPVTTRLPNATSPSGALCTVMRGAPNAAMHAMSAAVPAAPFSASTSALNARARAFAVVGSVSIPDRSGIPPQKSMDRLMFAASPPYTSPTLSETFTGTVALTVCHLPARPRRMVPRCVPSGNRAVSLSEKSAYTVPPRVSSSNSRVIPRYSKRSLNPSRSSSGRWIATVRPFAFVASPFRMVGMAMVPPTSPWPSWFRASQPSRPSRRLRARGRAESARPCTSRSSPPRGASRRLARG